MRKVALPERGGEALFGNHDENLRFLEDALKVRIKTHGQELIVEGDPKAQEVVIQVFEQLGTLMKDGYAVASGDVGQIEAAVGCLEALREGFRAIRDEAVRLERSGAIPPVRASQLVEQYG